MIINVQTQILNALGIHFERVNKAPPSSQSNSTAQATTINDHMNMLEEEIKAREAAGTTITFLSSDNPAINPVYLTEEIHSQTQFNLQKRAGNLIIKPLVDWTKYPIS